MKLKLLSALALGFFSVSAYSYDITVTTEYSFSTPSATYVLEPFGGPSPDTGFFVIANTGSEVFSGTVGDHAVSGVGFDFSWVSSSLTLNPGQTVALAVNYESSNFGGFNGPTNTIQQGAELLINGTYGATAVSLSAYDSQFSKHYVIQGGNAFGYDNGDGYEVNQTPGVYGFNVSSTTSVPEPEMISMFAIGLLGLGVAARKKA